MQDLPVFIDILFGLTTVLTVFLFSLAVKKSFPVIALLSLWLVLQAFISQSGFYTITNSFPPRFFLSVLPPLLCIAGLFILPSGRAWLDKLNIGALTILHCVRIAVELILFCLFTYKKVPQIMTFEGGNLDILSGITSIPVFYYGFVKHRLNVKILLAWNFVCLALLLNIVIRAVLSAPFPFQQFSFDQPNIAILHFPFIWLPCCIVPLVLLSHLATIRKLLKAEPGNNKS